MLHADEIFNKHCTSHVGRISAKTPSRYDLSHSDDIRGLQQNSSSGIPIADGRLVHQGHLHEVTTYANNLAIGTVSPHSGGRHN